MKITLIGLHGEEESIFPKLGTALSKKISGLGVEERFAPVAEDIPLIALESAVDSDFLIVFAPIDDEEMAIFVKKKLIDVELKTKTRILKMVDPDYNAGDKEAYEIEEDEKGIVKDIVDRVVNILFNERAFEPKKKARI